jgi:hypothetical protein
MSYNTLLYTIICDELQYIPTEIIKHIIYEYINEYQYKCSIDNDQIYDNVCLNEELGIIYCASKTGHKFIDVHNNQLHDSSIIDIKRWNNIFINDGAHSMLYFNNGVIITHYSPYIYKYNLRIKKYNNYKYIGKPEAICTAGTNMYTCIRDESWYRITVYDVNTLVMITLSSCFNINKYTKITMSIHNDVIYIIETQNTYLTKIHVHDRKTLNPITAYKAHISSTNTQVYKDRIYNLEQHKINIYDIKSLSLINGINVTINKCVMTIADDIIMISSSNRLIFYMINQ